VFAGTVHFKLVFRFQGQISVKAPVERTDL
jgi:hypothetical protein